MLDTYFILGVICVYFCRIYDIARVIQMNMEIALICAHICLIIPDMTARPEVCRIISILTHFFFLACFMFMFLEALHVYAMVASVVHKGTVHLYCQFTIPTTKRSVLNANSNNTISKPLEIIW